MTYLNDFKSIQVKPGFDVAAWFGYAATGGTPPAIVNRLNEEFRKAQRAQHCFRFIQSCHIFLALVYCPKYRVAASLEDVEQERSVLRRRQSAVMLRFKISRY